jgi:hypothetical protein
VLRCRELSEQASDVLEMTRRNRTAAWLHDMVCRDWRRYVQQLRLTVGAVARMRRTPSPVEASRVLTALGRER